MEFTANQIILYEYTIDNGPYMQATFASLIDADCADQAGKVLGADFPISRSIFYRMELTRAVELFPAKERRPRQRLPFKVVTASYKIIRHVLELATDADAETIRRRLQTSSFPFDFRYRRV